MKRYVDGIGYTNVVLVEVEDLPQNAVYFGFDDRFWYYVVPDADTTYMVDMGDINEPAIGDDDAEKEDDRWDMFLNALKADAAYCLGLEEGSDEWWELMDI